ncbi:MULTISPECIES: TetR/AcrR family transcriptional regulator [Niastella]|uniref:TetR/AcrR family transcriptional regulator n=1 Tax=Niastella soli TaxID=2821487 RepID=A0ABS3Z247_9BACT|nr:TetR/AcrR family transcriptional regulator [Niastella soli]MBO9204228.1 TetR/AcrR family transcriptional regulator [Niastella soli]
MNELVILETAYRLFTIQGIQLFTMDEIASRLAISKKTLYRFFTSRQHLVQQVCQLVADDYSQAMETAENGKADNLQRVLGFMAANVAFCKKISFTFFADLQKHYPAEYLNLTTTLNAITEQRLLGVLEQGIVEGVFRGSLHPKLVVTILLQHIKRDFEFAAELVNDYSKDEVFRQAMYLFLYGIIAPNALPQLENELKQYSLSNRAAHTEERNNITQQFN